MDNDKINIDVYSKQDIEKFLLLPKEYDFFGVERALKSKINIIRANEDLKKEEKEKMIMFVIQLRDKIVKDLNITPNYLKLTEMKPGAVGNNKIVDEGDIFKPFQTTAENTFESTIIS